MKLNHSAKAAFAALALLSFASAASASIVNLGAAGQFAALALNGNFSDSGPQPPSSSTSPYSIDGAVGVATAGSKFQASGSVSYSGNLYLHSGVSYNSSANGVPQATTGASTDALLNQAKSDAFAASQFALQLGQNPTATYGTINNDLTISRGTTGSYVFNIAAIDFSGGKTLTLSAPAGSSFVLNITDKFALTGGNILLAGGLTAADVLLNYTGTSDVRFSGGGNSSKVYGTILAPNATVGLHPGLVVGSVIADSITMSSGAQIIGITPIPEVTPASLLFGFLGLVVAVGSRKALMARVQARKLAAQV